MSISLHTENDENEQEKPCACCKSKIDNSLKLYLTKDTIYETMKKAKVLLSNNDYIALDKDKNILPLKDNIPQGEEAARLHLKKDSQECLYNVTRRGTANDYGCDFKKFNEIEKLFGYTSSCVFSKFGCEGEHHKIIAVDYDNYINVCEKHKDSGFDLMDINVANIKDINSFYHEYSILRLAAHTNNHDKIKLLKKLKIIMELAANGILKKHRLDEKFILYGIHYYEHKFDHENKNGWALVYTDFCDSIAHIFLDELTDDQQVKETLVLFAYENIKAKQHHDLSCIKSYIRNENKAQYKQLISMGHKKYTFDVPYILHYKLNI